MLLHRRRRSRLLTSVECFIAEATKNVEFVMRRMAWRTRP
jgi:hypothetical protein